MYVCMCFCCPVKIVLNNMSACAQERSQTFCVDQGYSPQGMKIITRVPFVFSPLGNLGGVPHGKIFEFRCNFASEVAYCMLFRCRS